MGLKLNKVALLLVTWQSKSMPRTSRYLFESFKLSAFILLETTQSCNLILQNYNSTIAFDFSNTNLSNQISYHNIK